MALAPEAEDVVVGSSDGRLPALMDRIGDEVLLSVAAYISLEDLRRVREVSARDNNLLCRGKEKLLQPAVCGSLNQAILSTERQFKEALSLKELKTDAMAAPELFTIADMATFEREDRVQASYALAFYESNGYLQASLSDLQYTCLDAGRQTVPNTAYAAILVVFTGNEAIQNEVVFMKWAYKIVFGIASLPPGANGYDQIVDVVESSPTCFKA